MNGVGRPDSLSDNAVTQSWVCDGGPPTGSTSIQASSATSSQRGGGESGAGVRASAAALATTPSTKPDQASLGEWAPTTMRDQAMPAASA